MRQKAAVPMKIDLKGLDTRETQAWIESLGLEEYRGRQIRHWIFKGRVASFGEMTTLPKTLREQLKEHASISPLEAVETLASRDGTRKTLFRCHDAQLVESVLIPERDHFTLCISSQVGCAMGCRFCLTGKQGLIRNLTAGEIVDQVVQVRNTLAEPDRLTNIVMMGMGEPLANYDAVIKAIGNLVDDDGMNFSHRKLTLSTCGLIPQMKRLGRDVRVNLAVSLNAADDRTRDDLMPINRKYPLEALMSACRLFPLPNRRMITFEYILLRGINDREEDAWNLVGRLTGIRAKVNLIPFNPHPGSRFSPSTPENMQRFQEILLKKNFTATIRKSKGQDILAACGQLSGTRKAQQS